MSETPKPYATAAVRGSATATVDPDFAVLSVQLRHQHRDREEAVGRGEADREAAREVIAGLPGRRSAYLSGLRVVRERNYDNATQAMVEGDWVVEISGELRIERDHVAVAAAAVAVGPLSLSGIAWQLDDTNSAHREARIAAVVDARRAAADFAEGAGLALGQLLSLADPGLLDAGVAVRAKGRGDMMAMAAMRDGGPDSSDLSVDPPRLTVTAGVEAVYELAPH